MDLSFNEDQQELRRSAQAFLEEHSSSEKVRAAMETEEGFDREVWAKIANEMGWPALPFAEEHGGYGLSVVDLVALLEETGRALLCGPFLSSVVIAGQVIEACATSEQKQEILLGPRRSLKTEPTNKARLRLRLRPMEVRSTRTRRGT